MDPQNIEHKFPTKFKHLVVLNNKTQMMLFSKNNQIQNS